MFEIWNWCPSLTIHPSLLHDSLLRQRSSSSNRCTHWHCHKESNRKSFHFTTTQIYIAGTSHVTTVHTLVLLIFNEFVLSIVVYNYPFLLLHYTAKRSIGFIYYSYFLSFANIGFPFDTLFLLLLLPHVLAGQFQFQVLQTCTYFSSSYIISRTWEILWETGAYSSVFLLPEKQRTWRHHSSASWLMHIRKRLQFKYKVSSLNIDTTQNCPLGSLAKVFIIVILCVLLNGFYVLFLFVLFISALL